MENQTASYPVSFQAGPREKDVALAFVGERSHDVDPVVEARVVRKIDLFLIPAMIVGYGLVYYDKVS